MPLNLRESIKSMMPVFSKHLDPYQCKGNNTSLTGLEEAGKSTRRLELTDRYRVVLNVPIGSGITPTGISDAVIGPS